jgi:hypothetical protein
MALPNAENLFGNIYDDVKYSDEHISDYFEASIAAMNGNNPGGRFNAIMSNTAPFKIAYDLARGVESSDLVHQLNGTVGENMAIRDGILFIRTSDSYLITKLASLPLVYAALMPRGRTEYDEANKSEIYLLFKRYSDMATLYAADLDSSFVLNALAMLTTYNTAHATHTSTIGTEDGSHSLTKTARTNLELQGMMNLRDTAAIFPGDFVSCLEFHPFSKLHSVPSHAHVKMPGSLTIGELLFLMTAATWADNVRIRLRAMTGDLVGGSISIALVDTETSPMPVDAHKTKTGKTNSFTAVQLQVSSASNCLIIKSNNVTLPAIYEVEIYIVNE